MDIMQHELEQAVLNGDRYTAYRLAKDYLRASPTTPEALWYLAYATDDQEEYRRALTKLAEFHHPELSSRARSIIQMQDSLVLPETRFERWWRWISSHVTLLVGILVLVILLSIAGFLLVSS